MVNRMLCHKVWHFASTTGGNTPQCKCLQTRCQKVFKKGSPSTTVSILAAASEWSAPFTAGYWLWTEMMPSKCYLPLPFQYSGFLLQCLLTSISGNMNKMLCAYFPVLNFPHSFRVNPCFRRQITKRELNLHIYQLWGCKSPMRRFRLSYCIQHCLWFQAWVGHNFKRAWKGERIFTS